MAAELQSTSPSGRYKVFAEPWEARMSLWVYPPEIVDAKTQELVLKFVDPNWSMDFVEWESETVVRLGLRKYPGDRNGITVHVDCETRRGEIGASRVSLTELEEALDSALNSQ